jgi:orotate phosphoribosyltransferase
MSTDWRKIFEERGAIWIHDGGPARPHALLTSGLHSDGFVNCTFITQDPALMERIVSDEGLGKDLPDERVDWVVGSAMGAITFAFAVAHKLGAKAGYTEKDGEAMKLIRFEIAPGERVLVVEDALSTGISTTKTIRGILDSGVQKKNLVPQIICLVNRSGKDTLEGHEVRALLTLDIHTWQPSECPLCREGSQAVRPKKNWRELVR